MRNIFLLVLYDIKSTLRKISSDLARELTMATVGAVVFGLFFYIAHDFLNDRISTISTSMQSVFTKYLSSFIWVLTILGSSKLIITRFNASFKQTKPNFYSLATKLGESQRNIIFYNFFRTLIYLTIIHLICLYILSKWLWLANDTPSRAFILILGIILSIAFRYFFDLFHYLTKQAKPSSSLKIKNYSYLLTLVLWRINALKAKNALNIIIYALVILFYLLAYYLVRNNALNFIIVLTTFMAGFYQACLLLFHLELNLKSIWHERNLGITHRSFVLSYELLTWILFVVNAVIIAIIYLLNINTAENIFSSATVTVFLAPALPLLLMPWIMFQLDARRPSFSIVVILLSSLFLITAVIISPYLFLLLAILRNYTLAHQDERFYRA